MTSQLRSDTARINGAKSHGPTSAEGRAISSQNALQHGVTSKNTIMLACEDPQEFETLLAGYMASYRPTNAIEKHMVEEMFTAHWRIRRLKTIETALIDYEMILQEAELKTKITPLDPGILLAVSFRALTDNSRAVALITRYESRLHRIHDRTLTMLLAMRQTQKSAKPASPNPAPQPIREPEIKNRQTNPAPAPDPVLEPTK
jgi:hypothetical protein